MTAAVTAKAKLEVSVARRRDGWCVVARFRRADGSVERELQSEPLDSERAAIDKLAEVARGLDEAMPGARVQQ